MKKIIVTQRVELIERYQERRDALDQQWGRLMGELDCCMFPLPNIPRSAQPFLETVRPDGILLTGGNSPVAYGGNAPERDDTDAVLIGYAIENALPLLGVCRGMQSILLYFGGSLKKVENHVGVRHEVEGAVCGSVNSYHEYCADLIPQALQTLAVTKTGAVEAIRCREFPILGIMWHPEREVPFSSQDKRMIAQLFKG